MKQESLVPKLSLSVLILFSVASPPAAASLAVVNAAGYTARSNTRTSTSPNAPNPRTRQPANSGLALNQLTQK